MTTKTYRIGNDYFHVTYTHDPPIIRYRYSERQIPTMLRYLKEAEHRSLSGEDFTGTYILSRLYSMFGVPLMGDYSGVYRTTIPAKFKCAQCGKDFPIRDMTTGPQGHSACPEHEDTVICAECENPVDYRAATRDPHDDEYVCADCHFVMHACVDCETLSRFFSEGEVCSMCEEERRYDEPEGAECLYSYGTQWDSVLPYFTLQPGTLYMGVELELESRGGSIGEIADSLNDRLQRDAFFKEDSSLDDGIETVTRPMVFDEQIAFWDRVLPVLREDLTARRTCGVHVHVSRSALSPLQQAKLLVMVNEPDNRELMVHIAGRGSGEYTSFEKKKMTSILQFGDRYEAINTQNNRTLEFRMFAATVDRRVMKRYLQFVDAIVQFTAPASSGISSLMSPWPFVEFVSRDRKRWRHLWKHLDEGGYV